MKIKREEEKKKEKREGKKNNNEIPSRNFISIHTSNETGDILLFSLPRKTLSMKLITSICPIKLQLLSQLCKRTWYNQFASTKKKKGKNAQAPSYLTSYLIQQISINPQSLKKILPSPFRSIRSILASKKRKLSFGFGSNRLRLI